MSVENYFDGAHLSPLLGYDAEGEGVGCLGEGCMTDVKIQLNSAWLETSGGHVAVKLDFTNFTTYGTNLVCKLAAYL